MHCVKTYWMGKNYSPTIPTETLILVIPLNISGAISFTLIMWYFYNPKNEFTHSKTRLVPYIEYMPEGFQRDVGPSKNDWKYVNIALLLGIVGVLLFIFVDFKFNIVFDYPGLHDFINRIHDTQRVLYYFSASVVLYWGFVSVVVACCVFFICCRDIIRHIEHTEDLIINKAKDYLVARHYHECLLEYTDRVMASTKVWFAIHSLFFMGIIVSVAFEWLTAFSGSKHYSNMSIIILSQIVGSLLIAFKFAFPILAASRVTAKFDQMYRNINREWCPDNTSEVGVFINYCIRCEAGFTLFGIKLTVQLAIISLLSCFVGLFKLYKKVQ